MSTINQLLDVQEQICYVQCSFCTTILLVSVPYSSMTMVVTVRCGHCTGLLSVNMSKASFVPLHLFSSSLGHNPMRFKHHDQVESPSNAILDRHSSTTMPVSPKHDDSNNNNSNNNINNYDEEEEDEDEDDIIAIEQIVNKPPEKKKRAPSAYNRFIKEEIRRLKIRNPGMTHKEAFSTAAKNWAHVPSAQDHENSRNDRTGNMAHILELETAQIFRSI